MSTKIFPTILIIISLCSAIVYASKGISEWRMVVYWLAAAALTTVVTY